MSTFNWPVRVYYEDTDAGGIVYHASYIRFAERGRTEMLRAGGWNHQIIGAEHGILLVVKTIEIDYRMPARLDENLTVETSILAFGNSSVTLSQNITRDGTVIAAMKVVVVAINAEGRPTRLPPQLRQILQAHSAPIQTANDDTRQD